MYCNVSYCKISYCSASLQITVCHHIVISTLPFQLQRGRMAVLAAADILVTTATTAANVSGYFSLNCSLSSALFVLNMSGW